VQVNEYGLRNEPKFSFLTQLHTLLLKYKYTLFARLPPSPIPYPSDSNCEARVYSSETDCLVFLSNIGHASCTFTLTQSPVEVPAWSVSILMGYNCAQEFNIKKSVACAQNKQIATVVPTEFKLVEVLQETIPSSAGSKSMPTVEAEHPNNWC